jgi:hypothetical protein
VTLAVRNFEAGESVAAEIVAGTGDALGPDVAGRLGDVSRQMLPR